MMISLVSSATQIACGNWARLPRHQRPLYRQAAFPILPGIPPARQLRVLARQTYTQFGGYEGGKGLFTSRENIAPSSSGLHGRRGSGGRARRSVRGGELVRIHAQMLWNALVWWTLGCGC